MKQRPPSSPHGPREARAPRSDRRLVALVPTLLVLASACGDSGPQQISAIGHDRLIEACIISSSCGVKRYPRVKDCLDAYYTLHVRFGLGPVYDGIYACLLQAEGDCEAVYACYGSHPAAGTCDTSYTASCDGDRALSCDALSHLVFSFDCSLGGLGCYTRAGGSFEAVCTVGTCTPGEPRRCDGDRLLSCTTDSVIEIDDCRTRGLVCGDGGGAQDCVGSSAEACRFGEHQNRCEGSVAVTCASGRINRFDCAGQPYRRRCADGACTLAGDECSDELNRCEGEALRLCDEGRWKSISCAGLGLGPCAEKINGADCAPM